VKLSGLTPYYLSEKLHSLLWLPILHIFCKLLIPSKNA
jgi:hypothetical protein